MMMMRLEDYLKRDAELYPDKIAVKCGEETCTFQQLWDKVVSRAYALLQEYGMNDSNDMASLSLAGRLIPFVSSQSIDFLVEYFAIHVAGGIAVPLEKGMTDAALAEYRQRLSTSIKQKDIADVLFTTGTTGKSKGVMISHSTIIANAENLIAAQGYGPHLTFIINGPLNHIGSLSKVYPMILVGGTFHILDGMKDLNAFFGAMEEETAPNSLSSNKKTKFATFLVPASIRMLLTFAKERLAKVANRIEFIETGAAPISQADMESLCAVLPHARLYNTYASTETGIIATYDFNHGECLAGCLGKPMKHSSFLIVKDKEGSLGESPVCSFSGKVACSGKTLMAGYYQDEALTQSVLKNGILYTSDIGEIDAEGNLHLKGRDGDVINVGGYKVSPTDVEDAALALPCIKDCICIPVEHRVLGTVLKLLVVLRDGFALDKKQIALALRKSLDAYKVPMLYEQVEAIKRTFNGKLDRKVYQT